MTLVPQITETTNVKEKKYASHCSECCLGQLKHLCCCWFVHINAVIASFSLIAGKHNKASEILENMKLKYWLSCYSAM